MKAIRSPILLTVRAALMLTASVCLLPCKAHAVVPLDGLYQFNNTPESPYIIIEQGSLKNAGGYLANPVCRDGTVLSPSLATDLQAFFAGYPTARIIDRGDGHYLLTKEIEITNPDLPRKIGVGSMYAIYAEIEFTSLSEGTFNLRAATAFFAGEGIGISTCHASEAYQLQREIRQQAVLESPPR